MAARYWVGGTAAWDATVGTKWSLTDGGAGGQAVPTASDDVYFTATSGAVTVTLSAAKSVLTLTCTGFTGTLACATYGITVAGNCTFVAGMTLTSPGQITISTAGTGNLTTGGKVLSGGFRLTSSSTCTLQDNLDCSTGAITFSSGTFSTNGKTVTCGGFSSVTGTSLTLGASVFNCSGNFDATNITTVTANTSSIRITGTGTFTGNGKTYYELQLNGTTHTIAGANAFTNLTRTGTATMSDTFTLSANQTVSGVLTLTGNSATNRLLVQSDVVGTARTLGIGSSRSVTNVDFQDISGSASAISGTSIGVLGGCTNITQTTPVTRYASSAGGGNWSNTASWATTNGGAGGQTVPLVQDTVYFGSAAGAGTWTIDVPRIPGFDCTGFTRTLALGISPTVHYGNIVLVAGMTFTPSTYTLTMGSRGSYTLTSGGKSLYALTVDAVTGTVTLGSDLTCTSIFAVNSGTFTASSYNVTATAFNSNTANTRTVNMGSGLWTLSGANYPWYLTTSGLTLNSQTANIAFTDTTSGARAFDGSFTYNKITIGGATGTSTFTFTGTNTIGELASTKTVAHTIKFTAGTTTNIGKWSVTGTSGNVVTIGSTTTSAATLNYTGAGVVSADYLSLSYSTATPGTLTWYAGANSTNGTGNTGWIFTVPPPAGGGGFFFGSNF